MKGLKSSHDYFVIVIGKSIIFENNVQIFTRALGTEEFSTRFNSKAVIMKVKIRLLYHIDYYCIITLIMIVLLLKRVCNLSRCLVYLWVKVS